MIGYLQIRVSKEFKEKITKAARYRGLTISAYVRDRMTPIINKDLREMRDMQDLEEDEPELAKAA